MDRRSNHSRETPHDCPNQLQAKKGFTLAEMIAAIALLAVFSVMVVQLFAASHTLARRTDHLDGAVLCARNLAERWQSSPQGTGSAASPAAGSGTAAFSLSEVDSLKPDMPTRLFYNEQLAPASAETAFYLADLTLSRDQQRGIESLLVTVQDPTGKILFELTAGRLARSEVKP